MINHWKKIVTLRITRYGMTAALLAFPLYLFSQEDGVEKQQTANTSQYPAYETFESILDRNIFNPNRRARQEEVRPVERIPDPDEIVLTGTIVTENDRFAFFEDSRSGDITVVSTGITFLGFEVESVNTDKVILKKGDTPIEISVLMALQKDQDSDWEVGESNSFNRSSSTTSSSNSSNTTYSSNTNESDSSSGSGDVQNEVLRKLLEKRRQEAGQ